MVIKKEMVYESGKVCPKKTAQKNWKLRDYLTWVGMGWFIDATIRIVNNFHMCFAMKTAFQISRAGVGCVCRDWLGFSNSICTSTTTLLHEIAKHVICNAKTRLRHQHAASVQNT